MYDADQQLTRVLTNGTLVTEYRYDLLNRRIGKKVGNSVVKFLYDDAMLRRNR